MISMQQEKIAVNKNVNVVSTSANCNCGPERPRAPRAVGLVGLVGPMYPATGLSAPSTSAGLI